jgi:hypothetical protein
MAVQVFKDGRNEFIDPADLQNHLAAGWTVEDPNAPLPKGITIINPKPEGEPHVVVPPISPSDLIPQPKKRGRPKGKA